MHCQNHHQVRRCEITDPVVIAQILEHLATRWASLFAAAASSILDLVTLPARTAKALAKRLEPMLLHEAIGPNRGWLLLLQGADQGLAWAC